ncbi:MAG: hypothetical protein RJQ21_06050 [Rhodospirillales bacterium]
MPFEMTWEEKGVLCRFHGQTSYEELFKVCTELWNHPDWGYFTYQVADFLDVSVLDLDETQAKLFAHFDKASALTCPVMRIALVAVNPDVLALAEAYVYTLTAPGWDARIFDDRDDAINWARNEHGPPVSREAAS